MQGTADHNVGKQLNFYMILIASQRERALRAQASKARQPQRCAQTSCGILEGSTYWGATVTFVRGHIRIDKGYSLQPTGK